MPRFEEALYSYLSQEAGVSAIVEDRIYPMRLIENAELPAISWNRISAERLYTYDPFEATEAWVTARIQFTCWGRTPIEAMEVGDAVLGALSGYGGEMAGELIGSVMAENELDDVEAASKFYRRIVDFMISYEEHVTAS